MIPAVTIGGLPIETVFFVVVTFSMPVLAYLLYLIDMSRTGGYVSLFGWKDGEQ